jgi:phenylalanyl-tRNA synthetase beta chain
VKKLKVPYNWLKEYVDIPYSPEELAERLTMAGIEVGALEVFAPLDGRFIIVKIEVLAPHPQDQKVQLVTVNTGQEMLTIVCGAWNMKEGDLAVLALPGAVLPVGGEIREMEIKGVPSQGMLCSAKELNLELAGADDGILLITDERSFSPGTPLREILPINEPVLDLELTPNRADCLGLLGVSREVAALTGNKIKLPPIQVTENKEDVRELARVIIKEPDLCPRFTARMMEKIKISPSPLKIQLRLLAAGIRPINNIVDVTNYVMWETGQPMHAYDFDKLTDGEIVVRCASPGEKIVTLDGVERKLDSETLVIADSQVPVGLAGIMGGEATEITPGTRRMLLEAACFNMAKVRRAARRLNLNTEASQRFEKGVDPEGIIFAQARAVRLMQETAGGEIIQGIVDSYPRPPRKTVINLRTKKVEETLGFRVSREEIEQILLGIGTTIQTKDKAGPDEPDFWEYRVEVPSYRGDLKIEVDLIEEIIRIKGYDAIPVTLPSGVLTSGRLSPEKRILERIKDVLVACGLQEVITYSFMNPRLFDELNLPEDDYRRNVVKLQNPLTEEQAVMRTMLVANLLQIMRYNFNRQVENLFLFELGKVFLPSAEREKLPREKLMLSFLLSGNTTANSWQNRAQKVDFYFLKGIIEVLLKSLGIKNYRFVPARLPVLHPTKGAILKIDDKEQGFLGAFHPQLQEKMEYKQDIYLAELNMEGFLQAARLSPSFKPLPRFPAVFRDLAFIVPRDVSADELLETFKECGGEVLREVVLFDLYQGNQIPEGHLSYAFSLTFQDQKRTLRDEDVDEIQKTIEKRFYEKYKAVLRKQ